MSGPVLGSSRAGERNNPCLQGAHRRQSLSELLQYCEGPETHEKGQYRLLEKVIPELGPRGEEDFAR